MKKIVLMLVALLCAGAMSAQESKLYISVGPGFGIGTARTYDLRPMNFGVSDNKVYPVGLGKGLNINLRAGYFLGEHIAIELGVVYRLGMATKVDYEGISYPLKATYSLGPDKFKSNMLQLVPAVVISPISAENKLRPYARLGVIVGLMPSIIEKADFKNQSGSYNDVYTFKYYGGIAVGGSAAIGCDFDLSEMLAIYAEFYFNALGYAPSKGKYIKFEENGVDVLANATTGDKEFEFVKDLTNYTYSDSSPQQLLKNSYTMNNAGLNVGVKIKL